VISVAAIINLLKRNTMEQTIETKTFTCTQCKTEKHSPKDSVGTGYGIDKDGNKVCYECCGENDSKHLCEMKEGERTVLYYSKGAVTNWPSTLRIPIYSTRTGKHNFARVRTDFWFDYKGHEFHGVVYGTQTEIAHIRKLKKHVTSKTVL
jgi:hypothetical protein